MGISALCECFYLMWLTNLSKSDSKACPFFSLLFFLPTNLSFLPSINLFKVIMSCCFTDSYHFYFSIVHFFLNGYCEDFDFCFSPFAFCLFLVKISWNDIAFVFHQVFLSVIVWGFGGSNSRHELFTKNISVLSFYISRSFKYLFIPWIIDHLKKNISNWRENGMVRR